MAGAAGALRAPTRTRRGELPCSCHVGPVVPIACRPPQFWGCPAPPSTDTLRTNQFEWGFGMEWVQWVLATVVACAGIAWFVVVRPMPRRGWRSLNERMAAQVSQSAELLSECSGSGQVGGRLSTMR